MSKPPFRKGVEPLFESGLLDDLQNPLARFFWETERLYLENHAFRQALEKAGVNPANVRVATPGSPGNHRKVFDKKYREIADYVHRKLFFLAQQKSSSRFGPN
jgi:hypothetical protein